jgi:23S rRNA (pseudouridine1915-N3)-methyltransferase
LNIEIIAVGKISDAYIKEGIDIYKNYMAPRITLTQKEVKEDKIPKSASAKDIENVKLAESKRLLEATNDKAFIIALTPEGSMKKSERFASMIEDIKSRGFSQIVFWIGGSHGISETIKKKAHMQFSLSKLTFPHQLTRLILAEQVFKALKISNNESYHK